MGTQQKWMGMMVILATLLLGSAGPGYAWQGGWHGGGWHGGGWHGGGWHGGPARTRFVFHNDFRHFTPLERRWWNGGRWSHRWWHGRYGWWWGVGGNFYFYDAPVYPYPTYVSPTYYGDDYYGDDDQGY